MKVLYLLNYAGNGGTEAYVKTLIQYLPPEVESHFIYSEPGPLLDWMNARGIPTAQVTMRSPFDLAAAKEVAAHCKQWGIQVIHTHFLRENYIAMLAKGRLRGVKVISTFHILTPVSLPIRLCNRLISRRQDAMVANCSAGRDLLIQNGVPAKKIRLIYNAVDPAHWAGGDRSALRRELGLDDRTFLMLFAARLVPGKGHTFLLDAVKQMEGDFCLALAGEGELGDSIRSYVAGLELGGRVRFLGHRTDMRALYAAADVTVCPSESETLSFLLLESLAAGTPVVATRVGGLTDIVTPETDCGLLVEYGDTAALSSALTALQNDPGLRARFAENGRHAVERQFHIGKITADILSLYRS